MQGKFGSSNKTWKIPAVYGEITHPPSSHSCQYIWPWEAGQNTPEDIRFYPMSFRGKIVNMPILSEIVKIIDKIKLKIYVSKDVHLQHRAKYFLAVSYIEGDCSWTAEIDRDASAWQVLT